jgi:ABC-type transporter Mla MlaB component
MFRHQANLMKQTKRKREPLAEKAESPSLAGESSRSAAITETPSAASAAVADRAVAANSRLFVLPPSCTVRDSIGLHASLVEIHRDPLPITLDVSAIERIDTAMMQVLCAFVRDRRELGASVEFVGCPEPFFEAVQLLGLAKALGFKHLANNATGGVAA